MNETSSEENSRSVKRINIYSDPSKMIDKFGNKPVRLEEIKKEIIVELNKKYQLKQVREKEGIVMIDKAVKIKTKRKNSLQRNAHLKKPKKYKQKNS